MPVKDPELIEAVQGLQCLACGCSPCDAHHVTSRGAGGGDTPENLMPLCRLHHIRWHAEGPWAMVKAYPAVGQWLELAGRSDVFARIARHTHTFARGKDIFRALVAEDQKYVEEPINDFKSIAPNEQENHYGISEEAKEPPH